MRPLNLILLNPWRSIGGGERWVLNLARGLKERGHRVLLGLREGGALSAEARQEGLECFLVPMSNDCHPPSVIHIAQRIKEHRAEVILTTGMRDLWLGGMAARLTGLKGVVARFSIWDPSGPGRKDLKYWRRRVIFNLLTQKVVTNAQGGKLSLVQGGWVTPNKIEVIYNGVDLAQFNPNGSRGKIRREFFIKLDVPLIVSVARLVSDKGLIYLVRAAEEVVQRFPQARFMLVGAEENRSYAQELKQVGAQLLSRGNLMFTGYRMDVPDILRDADLFVLPSLKEGLPNTILEAMAIEKPVIATEVCGIPEVIRDGVNGFLTPPRSISALVNAIVALLSDEPRRQEMGKKGRELIVEKFSLDKMIEQYEQLCYKVAEVDK